MKKILYTLIFCLTTTLLYAETPLDTIVKKKKGKIFEFEIYNGERDFAEKSRWVVNIELGFNQLLGTKSYKTDFIGSKYINIGLHKHWRIGGDSSWLSVYSGVEYSYQNLRWAGDSSIFEKNNLVFFQGNGYNLDRNKLGIHQITVPLMLTYQIVEDVNNKKIWEFGLGGYATFPVRSYSKIRFQDNEGNTQKNKTYNDFYLNKLRYGVMGYVGYKGFALFVRYDLNNTFEDEKAPKMQMLSFGLRL